MELTYLGTNTLLFRKASRAILLDPHFTRPNLLKLMTPIRSNQLSVNSGLARAGIVHLDGVLLTHTHYDHALDAVEVLCQAGGMMFGSRSGANLAQAGGLDEGRCVTVNHRKKYSVGPFQVRFHPSQHIPFPALFGWLMPKAGEIAKPLRSPAWFWENQCGSVYAIQVDHTLIFGSAASEPDAYRDLDIHAVVLSIGGLELQPQSFLEQLYRETVVLSGAMQVYLSHWDFFFRPVNENLRPLGLARRTIKRIRALGARFGQSVTTLQFGETISI